MFTIFSITLSKVFQHFQDFSFVHRGLRVCKNYTKRKHLLTTGPCAVIFSALLTIFSIILSKFSAFSKFSSMHTVLLVCKNYTKRKHLLTTGPCNVIISGLFTIFSINWSFQHLENFQLCTLCNMCVKITQRESICWQLAPVMS